MSGLAGKARARDLGVWVIDVASRAADPGQNMGRILGLALLLAGVLVFSVGISVAGAVTKVNSTEILDNGNLALRLEERGMKKFSSVVYRLDATASVFYSDYGQFFENQSEEVTLTPDDKGVVAGTLTEDDVSFPSGLPCTCGPWHVEYHDITLTNLATGHVYSLDPISRDFP